MQQIWEFFQGLLPPGLTPAQLGLFAVLCAVFGLLVLWLDWFLLAYKSVSVLDIAYGGGNRFVIAAGWSVAAGIVGALGLALQIFQVNLLAAISVAVGWPIIFTRIVAAVGTESQAATDEEEE